MCVCVSLCTMYSKQVNIEMSSSVASQSLSCEKSPFTGHEACHFGWTSKAARYPFIFILHRKGCWGMLQQPTLPSCWDLNSGPHSYTISILPTKLLSGISDYFVIPKNLEEESWRTHGKYLNSRFWLSIFQLTKWFFVNKLLYGNFFLKGAYQWLNNNLDCLSSPLRREKTI